MKNFFKYALLLVGATAFFVSCNDKDKLDNPNDDLNNVPYTQFIVRGNVTDQNGVAIKDIDVSAALGQYDQYYGKATDENGDYEIKFDGIIYGDTIYVKARDIDGTANGAFYADSTRIFFTTADIVPDANSSNVLFRGTVTKSANFALEAIAGN